jgi:hypothetical protein
MDLTEAQKTFLRDNAAQIPDLIDLTRQCFENKDLDGRSREGRAVRKFLVENSIDFRTTSRQPTENIDFTREQSEFILQQAENGLSSLEIARIVFPDRRVPPLSNEQRAVLSEIRSVNPDILPSQDSGALNSYISPKSTSRIIKKINDATGLGLDESKINRQKQICIEKLAVNLSNSRFLKIINNYLNAEDRVLFEHELIRLTWDKPDLTADEINLYLNVCKEVINLEVISSHLNKLNDMFDVADEQAEMSIRLAEIIKAKSSEYHQCETRIENLTKKLQGDRGERMKKMQKENASFLSIVQLFQEEEERKTMLKIAEMQKQTVRQEADRLENMSEWKARVLGISKDDTI